MSSSRKRPQPARGFAVSEFENRLAKAQKAMARRSIDTLLVMTEPEVRYFTGFLTQFWQSPTRPWFLLVPARGKPVAIIPAIGEQCMARTWIDDIRTWSSPHPSDDGIGLLREALSEITDPTGSVGVMQGRETNLRMPLADFLDIRDRFPAMDFVDATDLIRELRMVKSEAEIEKIAYICGVASDAFDVLPHIASLGDPEIEIFRKFKMKILELGADDCPYLVGRAGNGGYGDIISPPTDHKVTNGDVLILDTGSIFDGYFCDFDRNFAFGKASDDVRRAYEAVYRATEAGIEAARPGATTTDLFNAMSKVLAEAGALSNDVGRLGHGLGMQLTEWPSHTSWDHTELEPGMVLTIEPGMEFAPGKMMVHEENIVVREGAAQLLTKRAAPELPIIT
jgi:Xaa-Pro aminopeptidase